MNPELRKALAFFAVVGALAIGVGVSGTRVLGLAAGPNAILIKTLKDTEHGAFRLPIAGAEKPLESQQHHFDRIVVNAKSGADTATAIATLDFDGTLGETKVSSLGVETVSFAASDGAWKPTSNFAPRLTAIVSVLEARRRALETGDASTLARLVGGNEAAIVTDAELGRVLTLRNRHYQARAWLIRSEKDHVLVTEKFRLQGQAADRPVDEEGTRSLVLKESDGEFLFASGLM